MAYCHEKVSELESDVKEQLESNEYVNREVLDVDISHNVGKIGIIIAGREIPICVFEVAKTIVGDNVKISVEHYGAWCDGKPDDGCTRLTVYCK